MEKNARRKVTTPHDPRMKRLNTKDLRALAVEVTPEEDARMRFAARMGIPFLAVINRKTFIRFLCVRCGLDFSVRADAAILGRHRCPSKTCGGKE